VLKIKYKFMASDGSYVTATVIGEGMDSGDKAANKAMSIAHKYALFQVFAVATEDLIDPDSEEIGPTSKEKKNEDKKSAIKPKPVDNAVPSKNGKADSKPTEEAPKPPVKAKEETGNQNPPTGTKPVQSGADTTGSGVGELFQYVIGVINGAPKSGFVAKDAIPWMREVNTAKKTDDMKLMEELVKRLNEYLEADTEKKNEIMADLNQLPIF